MPKGVPKNGINKGWFKLNNHPPTEFKKEHNPWHKGKEGHPQEAVTREKIRKTMVERGLKPLFSWLGKKHTDSMKLKLRNLKLGKPNVNQRGVKHWNWQGGKVKEMGKIRSSIEYKNWRRAVYERDKYTCVMCDMVGGKLNADHIKPFCRFPELRLEISNGRTLCLECHKKTDTYMQKARYKIYD